MATLYSIKPAFQRLLQPLVDVLGRMGITPNAVTASVIPLTMIYSAVLFVVPFHATKLLLLLFPLVAGIRLLLNIIDGQLARQTGRISKSGAMLNELCDAAADLILYFPLCFLYGDLLLMAVVLLGVLCEVTGLSALLVGSPRRYDGPFGKPDRAVYFSVLAVLFGLGWVPQGYILTILAVSGCGLGVWTIWRRMRGGITAGMAQDSQ